MTLRTSLVALPLVLAASTAVAEDGPLLWQANSLTYLYGQDYQVDLGGRGDIQQTVTYEHASGWTWGDVFVFVDSKFYNGYSGNEGQTYYAELSPRLSFGKLSGRDLGCGPITDVLLAATYERGEDRNQVYLLGPGFDLAVPGFERFALNLYYRRPDGITGAPSGQWQVTPTWSTAIPLGRSDVIIDGFIDWVVNDAGSKARGDHLSKNLHINPQIKYDLGKALGHEPRTFLAGIEYDYWSNKYGIEDGGFVSENFVGPTDQNTASLLLQAWF